MVIYFYYLEVWGNIRWCRDLINVPRRCIFVVNECESATSPGGVGYYLLYTSCEGVCVVKNEFVFRE